jgi:hypothetical protein
VLAAEAQRHDISLRSAESIIAAMDPKRCEVQRIFITPATESRAILPEPGEIQD